MSLSNGNGSPRTGSRLSSSRLSASSYDSAHAGAASGDGARLERLAQRSEELLEDLDHARGDVLSVSDLNRTLKQVLRNQVEILRSLSAAPAPILALASAAPAPATSEVRVEGDGLSLDAGEPEAGDPASSDPASSDPASSDPASSDPASSDPATRAEALLGVTATIMGARARQAVADFDHRDKDFDKGLAKLKSWTEGGSGTPFQLRGDRAYLNINGSSPEGVKSYEKNLMQRMGFARRLGVLEVEGLVGEVVLYERP